MKQLVSRKCYVLMLAGAALLATGLAQLHAQSMGSWTGPVEEVDSALVDELLKNPNVIFVPILRTGAPFEQRTGVGNSTDSGHYQVSPEAVQFSGACEGQADCGVHDGKDYVEITGKVSTEALGVSASDPITQVIPAVIIKLGNDSCWWSCTSSDCDCVCAPAKNPPKCRSAQ